MELFSQNFVKSVRELFSSSKATVLATVPVTKQRPIPFVDELKKREDVTLIEVSIRHLQLVSHVVPKTPYWATSSALEQNKQRASFKTMVIIFVYLVPVCFCTT